MSRELEGGDQPTTNWVGDNIEGENEGLKEKMKEHCYFLYFMSVGQTRMSRELEGGDQPTTNWVGDIIEGEEEAL